MSAAIDFTFLREITDGDRALEQELFSIFFESADECIADMRASIAPDDTEQWRKQAHALKGSSLNLGANHLAGLCKKAQESLGMPVSARLAFLMIIEAEYAVVRACLIKEMAS